MKRVYLDHGSSTPLIKKAQKAMHKAEKLFGNPSSLHKDGRLAKECLEEHRTRLARVLSVKGSDIIFTSGATEANMLAVLGHVEALRSTGISHGAMDVLFAETEHESVRALTDVLVSKGVSVRYIPVRRDGRIDTDAFRSLLSPRTVLVSIALVTSEIGVIQPIRALREILHTTIPSAVFHTDASQAPLFLSPRPSAYGVEFMTLDSVKVGGPKGVGALIRLHRAPLLPIMKGGGQEGGFRGGTENVAGIVGFVVACEEAEKYRAKRVESITEVRNYAYTKLTTAFSDVVIHGSREHCIANVVHISLMQHDTEYLAVLLDISGVSVSTTSACSAGKGASQVISVLPDTKPHEAERTLRITLGPTTTKKDIDTCIKILQKKEHLTRL